MKYLAIALLLGVSLSAGAADRTVELSVPDMTCASCPVTVEIVLNKIDGVRVQSAELESKRVVALVRDDVPDEALLKAIRNAGYTPALLGPGANDGD